MQINLIPKTKEKELQQKRINFLVFSSIVLLIITTLVLILVLFGINLVKKKTISDLDRSISEVKSNIARYSKLEKNINSIVSGLDSIKQILDNRSSWINLFEKIENLMPKETFLTELSTSGNEINFKVRTTSIDKVAEFIESLRNYKLRLRKEDISKVKLFSNIEISNFLKEVQEGITYYSFDIKANFIEEIWKK